MPLPDPRITGCVLARNEEQRLLPALESLRGWTDYLLVLDNESTDRTADLARQHADQVLPVPRAAGHCFDGLRNLARDHAIGGWLFYLDADERVPSRLGEELQRLVRTQGDNFEALVIPFRNYFCGKWMEHSGWWPGYTRPQLLKLGSFQYNERLHSGVQVEGRTCFFPPDPELAITHYSYDDLHHYLAKLNRYTDGEAESLLADGASHSWQAQLAHFVHDWQVYYDRQHAHRDGMHGFVLAFMSAFYRFASRAKLWDLRRQRGELPASEPVPQNLREALQFMAEVATYGAERWLAAGQFPTASSTPSPPSGQASTPPEPPLFNGTVRPEDSRITALLMARNEERRIEGTLQSLAGWTHQILLLDHGSTDTTVEIARRYGAEILPIPYTPPGQQGVSAESERGQNFDALRNLALPHVTGDWVLVVDADERIPGPLAEEFLRLAREEGEQFAGIVGPYRNYFCGQWMRYAGWWPGYLHLQLLKRGSFRFNERLHGGIQVEGRTIHLPPDPERATYHHTYDDLRGYLEKLNRYTDGEAVSLLTDGASHSWQSLLAHFAHEWRLYYEEGRSNLDGMHGWVLSFMSAFYRLASRAKLWDLRRQAGDIPPEQLPCDLREMIQFMAQVIDERDSSWLRASHQQSSEEESSTSQPLHVSSSASRWHPKRTASQPEADVPAHSSNDRVPLLWRAPLLDPSGYADEARGFVLGLIERGQQLRVVVEPWGGGEAGLAPTDRDRLTAQIVSETTPSELFVHHTLPPLIQPSPYSLYNIARTMFETDRLPSGWETILNRMDRVWVPSEFNRETFVRSGVDPDRLAVVPGTVEWERFAGDLVPWPVPGHARFRFLTVFDWSLHKGWDVLLESFAREWGADPEVQLLIKTWSSNHYSLEDIRCQADAHLQRQLGRGLDAFPNLVIWEEKLPAADLPRLYQAVDAFVLPTRGEGWGRPLMEAMAAGLPTVATHWSGLTAFHDDTVGYTLPSRLEPVSAAGAREIPTYRGHCWAEPDREELRRLLRQVATHPEEARARGLAGRRRVQERYGRDTVARDLETELARCRDQARSPGFTVAARFAPAPNGASAAGAEARVPPAAPPSHSPQRELPILPTPNPLARDPARATSFIQELGRPLRVRWEGDQALLSSLALVNREFCLALQASGDVELSLGERRGPWHTLSERDDPRFRALFSLRDRPLSGPPDVTVRHFFPPDWRRPPAGKLVLIQPWEYGHLPVEWVAGATHQADEVWAYSRAVRDIYVRSSVPAEKVRVVPLGFRPEAFHPEGPAYPLPTEKPIRFLFVGGALDRKGADLLLEAYRRGFTRRDPVCLVVKDMGTRTFYQGATFGEAFRRAQEDPHGPEILYLDADLTEAELASLYRGCDCLALPYRGEGFALPPLEAMACGRLPIITAGGPTDDYVTDQTALRLAYRRRLAGKNRVGPSPEIGFDCVGDVWQLEPDLGALVAALQWVRNNPDEARQRGQAAWESVREAWTWETAAGVARERFRELVLPASTEETRSPATGPLPPAPARSNAPVGSPGPEVGRRWKPVRVGGPPSEQRMPVTPPSPGVPERTLARPTTPVELSLCMIVRDEEPRLGECLRSIAPYVDEMVVVDTGSQDRTREVARDCGALVVDYPWSDSFAAARNVSLAGARGRWLFWMDADDVISPECGAGLRKLIRRHPRADTAYQVQVRIPPGPGEFSPSGVDHVKLFPNRPEVRFEHRIHEQILPALRRAGIEVLPSDLWVEHRNYDRSNAGQARKRQRDFRLLELDLRDRPEHPFVLFNLGMTHLYATKEYEVAAHYLRRSLAHSDPQDSIVRKAYAMLATAHLCQGEWEAALRANESGRSYYPEDAELLFQAGQLYQQLGKHAEARRALERLTQGQDDPHYRSVDLGLRTYRGWHELALLFRRLGDGPHCVAVLQELADAHPGYLPAQLDLVEALCQAGREREAEQLLGRIPSGPGTAEELHRLRMMVGARRNGQVGGRA